MSSSPATTTPPPRHPPARRSRSRRPPREPRNPWKRPPTSLPFSRSRRSRRPSATSPRRSIGTQGMTTPPLPPALNVYSAAPAFPPAQGVPAPAPASPPPPPWSSWQPAPPPPASPCPHPAGAVPAVAHAAPGVGETEPPPVYSSAPAPPPVYTTTGTLRGPPFRSRHTRALRSLPLAARSTPARAPPAQPPHATPSSTATYDGVEDPLNWLNQCEQFFQGQRTLASYHLRGAARTWYYSLEQDEGGMPPWDCFRELFLLRFGPPIRGAGGTRAFGLHHHGSDFADRFVPSHAMRPG
ncbi:hypothetical protein QYE76_020620 [Lolium multiflorum]|uniref:Retrotransposon gag domain-containing protein n=1 Tax=Lolium multiflorum TaxID=4521 RepID=A0AAD8R974_LOLMU|nr:hypothetical protein QYE76_020620 [Lolium multiflorum]